MLETARRSGRTAAQLALSTALGLTLSGCAPEGLAFRVDERLRFVTPEDRATVSLPLTIDWDIRDFEVISPGGEPTKDAGYFAAFVDTTPMPPGESLRWVGRKDNACENTPQECLTAEYLSIRGVYPTSETKLVLKQLPLTGAEERRERHRVTIVLLDASGSRIGESAFELAFDIERKDLS